MNIQPGYMTAVGFLSNVTGGAVGTAGKAPSSTMPAQALSGASGPSLDFTPIADLRSAALDQLGTNEDKLKALSPSERQGKEDEIVGQIRATLGPKANGKEGSLVNISV